MLDFGTASNHWLSWYLLGVLCAKINIYFTINERFTLHYFVLPSEYPNSVISIFCLYLLDVLMLFNNKYCTLSVVVRIVWNFYLFCLLPPNKLRCWSLYFYLQIKFSDRYGIMKMWTHLFFEALMLLFARAEVTVFVTVKLIASEAFLLRLSLAYSIRAFGTCQHSPF